MKTIDYFRKALLRRVPNWGDRTVLSRGIGIALKEITALINGKKGFSETRMEKIANFYNTTYIEMVIESYKLDGHKPESEGIMTYTPEDISNLIKTANNMSKIFEKDIQELKKEMKKLTEEIKSLKLQCESTQKGLNILKKKVS